MSTVLRSPKECRSLYRDILQGHSFVLGRDFYIKHYKESDLGFLENTYQVHLQEAVSMGFLKKEEKLAFLKEEDYWSQEQEEEFTMLSLAVNDAKEHYNKLALQ